LSINAFDLIVVGAILFGGLVGFVTGFVRGGLFVASWFGAVFATMHLFAIVQPYARHYVEPPLLADLVAGAVLFLTSLLVLHLVSHLVSAWVRDSRLNSLDRSVGLVSGFITAAAVIALAYLPFSDAFPPSEQPDWLREARTRPVIERAALTVRALMPAEIRRRTGEALARSRDDAERLQDTLRTLDHLAGPPDPPAAGALEPGAATPEYSEAERNRLDELLRSQN